MAWGGRQTGAFEPDTAEQDVRLDDVFQGRRDDLPLVGELRGRAIGEQRIVAEPGDVQTRCRTVASALVWRVGAVAGSGLEPGGQSVAHPRNQKPCRCLRDDAHVNEYGRRVRLLVQRRFEHAVLGIAHRASAARGVGRGDRGDDDRGYARPGRRRSSRCRWSCRRPFRRAHPPALVKRRPTVGSVRSRNTRRGNGSIRIASVLRVDAASGQDPILDRR